MEINGQEVGGQWPPIDAVNQDWYEPSVCRRWGGKNCTQCFCKSVSSARPSNDKPVIGESKTTSDGVSGSFVRIEHCAIAIQQEHAAAQPRESVRESERRNFGIDQPHAELQRAFGVMAKQQQRVQLFVRNASRTRLRWTLIAIITWGSGETPTAITHLRP